MTPPNNPPELGSFDFGPRTRVLFGVGSSEQLGERARELGARRVLLVTDSGLVRAGHAGRIESLLRKAGLETALFDRVRENPTTRDVDLCVEAARTARIDFLIGLGGGSAMDTAKGCNFILSNGGQIRDYWGVGKASKPMLPFIAVPTTAGTGSECQSAALIADEATHHKMACLDPKAAARVAVLDPALTLSQPLSVTARTGVDAIAHALESAVCTRRTLFSRMFSRESFELTVAAFPKVLNEPQDVQARGRMLLGAALAGMAIENSMLGAAHAAANPLTAHYGIVHGEAVGLLLPAVVRFNAGEASARQIYAELATSAGIAVGGSAPERAVDALVDRLASILHNARIARSLEALEVRADHLESMAAEAAQQWTARFNPRPLSVADFADLYRAAFSAR